jgi:hypothetical protein
MTNVDSTAAGGEIPAPLQSSERSNRQLIGLLLTAYGAVEAAFLGWLALFAMQGLNESQPWLVPAVLALSVPCGVAFVGLGLVRDRRWAYWVALMLPFAVVPSGVWWIMNPHGRPESLWRLVLDNIGVGAFFALGTAALSVALLLTTSRRRVITLSAVFLGALPPEASAQPQPVGTDVVAILDEVRKNYQGLAAYHFERVLLVQEARNAGAMETIAELTLAIATEGAKSRADEPFPPMMSIASGRPPERGSTNCFRCAMARPAGRCVRRYASRGTHRQWPHESGVPRRRVARRKGFREGFVDGELAPSLVPEPDTVARRSCW